MDQLVRLYHQIDVRGQRAIQTRNEQVDPYLTGRYPDNRRGLTLLIHLPAHISRNINFGLLRFKMLEPEMYFYPSTDMHITVMDLIGARTGLTWSAEQLRLYCTVIRRLTCQTAPINWKLAGLIASPGALLVKGTYSANLTTLRQQLRQALPAAGLPLQERYQTIMGHVTVARFPRPLRHRQKFLQLLKANSNLFFGTFTVDQLDLVIHDWYNHHARVIDSFQLAGEH